MRNEFERTSEGRHGGTTPTPLPVGVLPRKDGRPGCGRQSNSAGTSFHTNDNIWTIEWPCSRRNGGCAPFTRLCPSAEGSKYKRVADQTGLIRLKRRGLQRRRDLVGFELDCLLFVDLKAVGLEVGHPHQAIVVVNSHGACAPEHLLCL